MNKPATIAYCRYVHDVSELDLPTLTQRLKMQTPNPILEAILAFYALRPVTRIADTAGFTHDRQWLEDYLYTVCRQEWCWEEPHIQEDLPALLEWVSEQSYRLAGEFGELFTGSVLDITSVDVQGGIAVVETAYLVEEE